MVSFKFHRSVHAFFHHIVDRTTPGAMHLPPRGVFPRRLALKSGTALLMLAALTMPAAAQTLVVAADSSLDEALQAVARDFERGRPGVSVTLRTGAAGALLQQVAGGTATDVLTSDDAQTAESGVRRRLLVSDLRSAFASNTLVLVTPAALNLPLQRLVDLGRPEIVRIAMGDTPAVPAGRYAREAINAQRMWPQVQRKVVPADDVRAVLGLVARAEVEAGFVYASDARVAGPRVRVVETLPTTTPIRYVANVVASSSQTELARAFIDHLRSDPAQAVFKREGFGPP